jgi:hypothetical protein
MVTDLHRPDPGTQIMNGAGRLAHVTDSSAAAASGSPGSVLIDYRIVYRIFHQ